MQPETVGQGADRLVHRFVVLPYTNYDRTTGNILALNACGAQRNCSPVARVREMIQRRHRCSLLSADEIRVLRPAGDAHTHRTDGTRDSFRGPLGGVGGAVPPDVEHERQRPGGDVIKPRVLVPFDAPPGER